MSLSPLHLVRLGLPVLVLGLALAPAANAQALAGSEQGMLYIFSVTAPALRAGCDQAMPAYAESFDGHFSQWRDTYAKEIQASKQALLDANAGTSATELDALIASSAERDFAKADQAGKEQACHGLLQYMEASGLGE